MNNNGHCPRPVQAHAGAAEENANDRKNHKSGEEEGGKKEHSLLNISIEFKLFKVTQSEILSRIFINNSSAI